MTYEESIEGLRYLSNCTASQFDYVDEVETAIECLEKQIPKKPTETFSFKCPRCGNEVFNYDVQKQKFCSECGQAILWEE